jgi:hypothetical protein
MPKNSTLAASCQTISHLTTCFIAQDGQDLFAEFLETLIFPPVPSGISPELVQSVWAYATALGDDAPTRQQAVGDAYTNADDYHDLARRWRELVAQ